MVIDLTDPLFGPIAAALIVALIIGTYHYIRTLVALNVTNEKLRNILSELHTLKRQNEEEITKINKDKKEEIEKTVKQALVFVSTQVDEIIKHNQPPRSQPKTLAEIVKNLRPTPKRKNDS